MTASPLETGKGAVMPVVTRRYGSWPPNIAAHSPEDS
jgi:hypothetical protein